MNLFLWHVHGSWTTAFVQGPHRYFVPVLPRRGPNGRGRARTWDWPASVEEIGPREARDLALDAVVVQRPSELFDQVARWTGRQPGKELPCVYLEHNAPEGRISSMRHPAFDRRDVLLAHVTHFNALFWDAGTTPTTVVEHGIVDPGYLFCGDIAHAGVVVNDPLRRGRTVGLDLIGHFSKMVPVDLFGMRTASLGGKSLRQAELHRELSRRRAYLHLTRWTSLGLSLIEAMHLGMPIVALATTEAPETVPDEAGVISNRLAVLEQGLRRFLHDPGAAADAGRAARKVALDRFGLERFLSDWEQVLGRVVS